MNVVTYLSQVDAMREELEEKERKIDEFLTKLYGQTGIAYDKERVQTSPQDRMIELFERFDELRRDYIKSKKKMETAKRVIENQLARLDPLQGEVLRLMYVEGMRSTYRVARVLKKRRMVIDEAKRAGLEEFKKRYSHMWIDL